MEINRFIAQGTLSQEARNALAHLVDCKCCHAHLQSLVAFDGLASLSRIFANEVETHRGVQAEIDEMPGRHEVPMDEIGARGSFLKDTRTAASTNPEGLTIPLPRLSSALDQHELKSLATVPASFSHERLLNYAATQRLERIGKYDVLAKLGEGGFGNVYHVRESSIGKHLAIKVIKPDSRLDARQQLLDEARRCCKVRHPNVVAVYDVDSTEGIDFMVMELIDGQSIHAHLNSTDLSLQQKVKWFDEIAAGLSALHAQGVLHLDVKPSNVMIESVNLAVKITDMGLERYGDDRQLSAVARGGTPAYMSPEQIRGQACNQRSDLFSLGVLMYEMLCERRPFLGDRQELAASIQFDAPLPPHLVNRAVPRDLSHIALKCLEKNPADRYQSAHEFQEDLRRWKENQPIRARPTPLTRRMHLWTRRNRLSVASVIFASLAVLSALVFYRGSVLSRQDRDRTSRYLQDAREFISHNAQILAGSQDPYTRQLREQLLRKLVVYSQGVAEVNNRFIRENPGEFAAALPERAEANSNLAIAFAALGDREQALAHVRDAQDDIHWIAQQSSKTARQLEVLAGSHTNLSILHTVYDYPVQEGSLQSEVFEALKKSLDYSKAYFELEPSNVRAVELHGAALINLGSHFKSQERWEEAQDILQSAFRILDLLPENSLSSAHLRLTLSNSLGAVFIGTNQLESAESELRHTLSLIETFPEYWRDRNGRPAASIEIESRLAMADLAQKDGNLDKAALELRKSLQLAEHEARRSPPDFQSTENILEVGARLIEVLPGQQAVEPAEGLALIADAIESVLRRLEDVEFEPQESAAVFRELEIRAWTLLHHCCPQSDPRKLQALEKVMQLGMEQYQIPTNYIHLAGYHVRQRDYTTALQLIARALGSSELDFFDASQLELLAATSLPSKEWFNIACVLTLAGRELAFDYKVAQPERERLAELMAEWALKALGLADMQELAREFSPQILAAEFTGGGDLAWLREMRAQSIAQILAELEGQLESR